VAFLRNLACCAVALVEPFPEYGIVSEGETLDEM
jgi:hypothetical protein